MEFRAVVRESVTAWRKTKHPRIAAVAEWATAKALSEAPPRAPLPTRVGHLRAATPLPLDVQRAG